MRQSAICKFICLLALGVVTESALATTLGEAAQQAVLHNPEVQARWNNFNGAMAEQDVARGGYLPRLDVTAGVGREHLVVPNQMFAPWR